MAVSVKERKTQFFFQAGDAAAHGSLGDMAGLCRFGKVEIGGNRVEIKNFIGIHLNGISRVPNAFLKLALNNILGGKLPCVNSPMD